MTDYTKLLFNPKIDKKSVLHEIKINGGARELEKIYRKYPTHPIVRRYVLGNPKPTKISELGNTFFPLLTDLQSELGLLKFVLSKYSTEVNKYIQLKQQFEIKFYNGEINESTKILKKIEDEICYSLWGFEQNFLVKEVGAGFAENKAYLADISQENNSIIITSLAHFLSVKAEKNISPSNYNDQVLAYLQTFDKEIQDYFIFKVCPLEHLFQIESIKEILFYDSVQSIIDRYNTFIKISQLVLLNSSLKDFKQPVAKILIELKSFIVDPLFDNLLLAYETGEENFSNLTSIDAFEAYTTGDYQKSKLLCAEILQTRSVDLCIIELFVKSLIYLNESNTNLNSNKSICNDVIRYVYYILTKQGILTTYINHLKKVATQLQNSNLAAQIQTFLTTRNEEEENLSFANFKYLNTPLLNPLKYNLLPPQDRIPHLNKWQHLLVYKLFYLIETCIDLKEIDEFDRLPIPRYRKSFYKAKTIQKNQLDLTTAVTLYNDLITSYKSNPVIVEESSIELLKCLYKLNRLDEYISVYVALFFFNKQILDHISYLDIHKKIEINKFSNIKATIELPIFYKITNQKDQIINITIRHFLKKFPITKPSEFGSLNYHGIGDKLVIYFLHNVCTQEVIKYFPFWQSTEEIYQERLKICNLLVTIDPPNAAEYKKEIDKILQSFAISEGIKQVDESKIFVDERGLRDNELFSIKNNYSRYIQFNELIKRNPMLLVDMYSNQKTLSNLVTNTSDLDASKSLSPEDYKFNFFRELFLEIRDQFLFNSKYGLDSYLSTRIRHGTLLGQIRSIFQDQYLITQKDVENQQYFNNEYWKKKLSLLDFTSQDQIQKLLATFSENVDSLTNSLKNDILQIATERRTSSGAFVYAYPHKTVYYLYKIKFYEIDTYDHFLDKVFGELWSQTAINLEVIRMQIQTSIKTAFFNYLNNLETDVKLLQINTNEIKELLARIVNARLSISHELDTIANWFQIKENNVKNFNIEKAIDTSIEITNRVSQTVLLKNITKNITSQVIIKGEYFISFFDLFRQFFENITKYAHLNSDELEMKISVEEGYDSLHIIISNNLNDNINKEELSEKLKKIASELNRPNWDIGRTKKDENSGFYKAKNILQTHLRNSKNKFSFCVTDEGLVEVEIFVHLKDITI